jgi:hypothetical protein
LAYQQGQSLHLNFTCEASGDHVKVSVSEPKGNYKPWFHELQLEIYGVSGTTKRVTADHHPVTGWKAESGLVILPSLPWAGTAHTVDVEIENK